MPEAEKHVLIGYVINGLIAVPLALMLLIALPAISLDNVHLALIKSYILDSRVIDHVCNDRSRFIDFILVPSDELLVIGTTAVYIKGHRTVSITIECKKTESTPDGKRTF